MLLGDTDHLTIVHLHHASTSDETAALEDEGTGDFVHSLGREPEVVHNFDLDLDLDHSPEHCFDHGQSLAPVTVHSFGLEIDHEN